MTKNEMIRKLELYNGIGVQADMKDGMSYFFFYEDFPQKDGTIDKGIDRAFDTFNTHPYVKKIIYYPQLH